MATRTISTRLVLEGEAEYRAQLKNVNAELALQKSELEKVESQYRTSANSMEALTAKGMPFAPPMRHSRTNWSCIPRG